MPALTQLTQIPPRPQDTRTHHGITTASSRISPTWPGGAGCSCLLGGKGRCYSLLPAHSRIAWRARQALCGSLAALELLTRSAGCQPRRQYDSSGLSHLAQPVGRRGASFGCATLKDPLLVRPVDLEPCILVLLPLRLRLARIVNC
jgi:hypothetical protein